MSDPSSFRNKDGSKWSQQQIIDYYKEWNAYTGKSEVDAPLTQTATSSATHAQYNSFSNPFVNKGSGGGTPSALEAARLSGKAPAVSSTPIAKKWPTSLKLYVGRVFEKCTSKERPFIEEKLKALIEKCSFGNSIWTIPWDLVEMPNPYTPIEDLPNTVIDPHRVVKVASKTTDSLSGSGKKKKVINSMQTLESRLEPRPAKKPKTTLTEEFGMDKKEERKKRFESEQKEAMKKMQKKQVVSYPAPRIHDGNPDSIDWNLIPIVGTCAELEKPYLRLTAAPDPSTVRPLEILIQAHHMLKSKWKKEHNYTYICDQLKSLRQDLTVQRIKNDFTVAVYETHSRIAIEKGDLGEFNQCSAQLKQLYTIYGLRGCQDEFTAYRILYMIHTLNRRDLIQMVAAVPPNPEPCVLHALQVRSSVSTGNYLEFFALYHKSPGMSVYLMDHFLDRERLKACLKLCKSYRPNLTIDFFARNLGFVPPGEHTNKKNLRDTFTWLRGIGIEISKGDIDCKQATFFVQERLQATKGVDIKGQIH